MFEGLAKFVVEKWYVVLAIWVLLIILSAPLSSLFLKSVSYQVTISVPGSTSAKAENIVSHYFRLLGASGSNAVLIIEGNVSKYSSFLANLTSYGNISLYNFYTIEKGIMNQTLYLLVPQVNNLTKVLMNISQSEKNITVKLQNEYVNLSSQISKLEDLHNATLEVQTKFINVSATINKTALQLKQLQNSMKNNYTTFLILHEEEIGVNDTIHNIALFLFTPVSAFLKV